MLLQMLGALEATDVRALDAGALVAAQVRAVRRAFEDRERCVGDPRFVDFALEAVLPRRAHATGDTTSLSVVDADGNAVSMIQSLWVDAGVMVPGTGILLNARLNSCTVVPGHPDIVAGGKTPVYTMHTFMVTRGGALVALGGTPGGNSQVQTNFQVDCYMGGLDGPPMPPNARQRPGKAVALLESRGSSKAVALLDGRGGRSSTRCARQGTTSRACRSGRS